MDQWRIWTDPGGLTWADPGPDRAVLRSALEDCAETLSPVGQPPALSTYWLDHRLAQLELANDGEIANGNLWTLTVSGDVVEVRMNVDPPTSPALDVVGVAELIEGLRLIREEVVKRRAAGHALEDRYWSQRSRIPESEVALLGSRRSIRDPMHIGRNTSAHTGQPSPHAGTRCLALQPAERGAT